MIFYVISKRAGHGMKAVNPLSGNEHLVEAANKILRNTLEQFVFAFVNQLILVTHLPADYLHVMPFLVFYFTFGRLAFFVGYVIDPMYRTVGFLSTFTPTLLVFGANLLFVTGFHKQFPFLPSGNNFRTEL